MAKKKTTRKKTTRKTVAKKRAPANKGDCFVIMQFGGWNDIYYDSLFSSAIKKAGLTPRRADDIFTPTPIINDIWSLTLNCKVLLADLTGKNPNVLYELGLAHASCKPVVIITESIDDVPFDLQSLRVIVYDKNEPKWGSSLSSSITQSLKDVLDNPDASVPTTFLSQHPTFPKSKTETRDATVQRLRLENDRLRRQSRQSPSRTQSAAYIEELVADYLRQGIPPSEITLLLRKRGFNPKMVHSVMKSMMRSLD